MADFVEATLQAWDQGEGNAPLFEKPNLRALAKHLKRPPFKFLCDVILKTAAATECFRGLYSGEEVETASNKDKAVCTKEVKMAFLRKAIVALHLSGYSVAHVNPKMIVSGKEPAATNDMLQALFTLARRCSAGGHSTAAAVGATNDFFSSGSSFEDFVNLEPVGGGGSSEGAAATGGSGALDAGEGKAGDVGDDDGGEGKRGDAGGSGGGAVDGNEGKAADEGRSEPEMKQRDAEDARSAIGGGGGGGGGGGRGSAAAATSSARAGSGGARAPPLSSFNLSGDMDATVAALTAILDPEEAPKLTREKHLKRPPFRYLFDLCHIIFRRSGFSSGLFDEDEKFRRGTKNFESREDKMEFLRLTIECLRFFYDIGDEDAGNYLPDPKRIVAGKDTDRTRMLLELLCKAAHDCQGGARDSAEAVAFTLDGSRKPGMDTIPFFAGGGGGAAAVFAGGEGKAADANDDDAVPAGGLSEFEAARMRMEGMTDAQIETVRARREEEEASAAATAAGGGGGSDGAGMRGKEYTVGLKGEESKTAGAGPARATFQPSSQGSANAGPGVGAAGPGIGARPARPSTARRRPPKVKENAVNVKAHMGEEPKEAQYGIIGDNDDDDEDDEEEEEDEEENGLGGGDNLEAKVDGAGRPSGPSGGRGARGKLTRGMRQGAHGGGGGDGDDDEGGESKDNLGGGGGDQDDGGIRMGKIRRGRKKGKDGKGSGGGSGMSSADIKSLRDTVQRLCSSTNPLGKCMDYVQNDLALMKQEYAMWASKLKDFAEQYESVKSEREEWLGNSKRELEDTREKVKIMEDKIHSVKADIVRNNSHIAKLVRHVVQGQQ